jgi:hypothetical protein
MSRLHGPVDRSLQDRFDTRRLADNVETRVVLTEIPQEHKAFIESRDAALLERLATEPHTRLRYFCFPQHTDSALYPIIGQMERAAEFADGDSAQVKLDASGRRP